MNLTQFVLLALGMVYAASGIAVLTGNLNFKTIADDLEQSPALTFICGAAATVAGLALVFNHNFWVVSPAVIVTILGWGLLAGGLLIIIWPRSLTWAGSFYIDSKAWGLLMFLAGVACTYLSLTY